MSSGGSSPHTWGIHSQGEDALEIRRFIPTYVGHTIRSYAQRCITAVHPHIRGAYDDELRERYYDDGSSPHTWGIRGG